MSLQWVVTVRSDEGPSIPVIRVMTIFVLSMNTAYAHGCS